MVGLLSKMAVAPIANLALPELLSKDYESFSCIYFLSVYKLPQAVLLRCFSCNHLIDVVLLASLIQAIVAVALQRLILLWLVFSRLPVFATALLSSSRLEVSAGLVFGYGLSMLAILGATEVRGSKVVLALLSWSPAQLGVLAKMVLLIVLPTLASLLLILLSGVALLAILTLLAGPLSCNLSCFVPLTSRAMFGRGLLLLLPASLRLPESRSGDLLKLLPR